jgi:integrase
MRKTAFTDKHVAALEPRAKRYTHADPEQRGHYIRVTPNGQRSFVAVANNPHGKQIWATIGGADVLTIEDAREQARAAIRRIGEGLPAFEAAPNEPELFPEVAEQWLKRHVRTKGLISEKEIVRLLNKHVYPASAWGRRPFTGVRRGDVTALLDRVEDNHNAREADYVLAVVRNIFRWYEARNDDYTSPVVRGMRRYDTKAQERSRILDDDELRAIWKQAEANGAFGALIQLLLLTGQRLAKTVSIKWDDVVDGVWTIPQAAREKGTAGELVLPKIAIDIIEAQPRLVSNPHVLAGRGDAHINGFSKSKKLFDAKLENVDAWVLHDLRRTARSLMSRAGVSSEHAERVLGHRLQGVEGVYDRHRYFDEKAEALRKLAALIDSIVNPRSDNVLPIAGKKRKPRAS